MVKMACCSFRGPKFSFQHTPHIAHNCLQLQLLGVWRHLLVSACICIHTFNKNNTALKWHHSIVELYPKYYIIKYYLGLIYIQTLYIYRFF